MTAKEVAIGEQLDLALARSGYPLHNVFHCSDDRTIVLSGFVTRFFHIQMVIEAVRPLAKGRRIELQIEVVSAPKPNPGDG